MTHVPIFTHPSMLSHAPGAGHPESPERLKAVLDALDDAGLARDRCAATQAEVVDLGDRPHIDDLICTIKVMLDDYREGNADRLFLMGNRFVNTMTQKPESQQLLPVQPADDDDLPDHWDYIYEPEPAELLEDILVRYVEAQVYQGVVENVACEMAARMVAMKSASDNAGDIIDDLQLEYNKQRQAAITQELSEIVAGAAAVS